MSQKFYWIARYFAENKSVQSKYFETQAERNTFVQTHSGWKKRGKICVENLEKHLLEEHADIENSCRSITMITVKEVDSSFFERYDSVSMIVKVSSEYKIKRIDNGLGGMLFEEKTVEPYTKDFSIYERATEYEENFDISNWRFYMAFDREKPVGAMTVAGRTKNMDMLGDRDDACVLWDIRVENNYKHQGIGQKLFDLGVSNAKADGYRQMIIECQNNNVPACHFYKKQGALLSKIDMYAYYLDEDIRDEIQLLWYLDL